MSQDLNPHCTRSSEVGTDGGLRQTASNTLCASFLLLLHTDSDIVVCTSIFRSL